MWEPKLSGAAVGWLVLGAVLIHFFHDDMANVGVFGQACEQWGLGSWSCGVLPNLVVWASDTFMHFLSHPLDYDASNDWIGADYAMMWIGSPFAYAAAVVAANYWVWMLNRL